MTTENRERLIDLLHLARRVDQARVHHLPDEVVDFFVYKAEELTLRRHYELLQSMHDTVAAFDSEGLGTWQSDFDRWHAARAVKH
jgi:hypothetical protein